VALAEPGVARIVAPDPTQAAARYSDVELEAIIRHGLRPDGRSVVAMPSEMFRHLRDEELARILAHLRSVPPANGPAPEVTVGWKGRIGLALGEFHTTEHYVQKVERLRFEVPDSLADGLYLARTACTECHSADLTRDPSGRPPDLKIVAGYSEAQFRHSLHTGEALGGRELPLMSEVARHRLSAFTDAEVTVLYRYLRSRAAG
jgi:cytochrome c553